MNQSKIVCVPTIQMDDNSHGYSYTYYLHALRAGEVSSYGCSALYTHVLLFCGGGDGFPPLTGSRVCHAPLLACLVPEAEFAEFYKQNCFQS